jgi:hypothetical protein
MLRTLLVSAAVSGLMISGIWAQSTDVGSKFVASQSSDQWVFSKFKGTDVIGQNDESIGSVNDLLFDKSGKVLGVVVGVGGFLGIGQKNVAMDMGAFQVVAGKSSTTTAPVTGRSDDPTNMKLKVAWTKEQVQQAPDFKYYAPPSETNAPPATTGVGQRPGPMSPQPAPRNQ